MSASRSHLLEQFPSAWRALLPPDAASHFASLEALLESEERRGQRVFPPRPQLFAALEAVVPGDVRVVLLGQDPYPTLGMANGLAFSVAPGTKLPASLRRLYEAVALDTGRAAPTGGDLSGWARQGVLLLNAVLTVREGEPGSHRKRGWEEVTRALLQGLCGREEPLIFLSLGRQAEALVEQLAPETRHVRVVAPHPSPLTGRRFLEVVGRERPFGAVNDALLRLGRAPIEWSDGRDAD